MIHKKQIKLAVDDFGADKLAVARVRMQWETRLDAGVATPDNIKRAQLHSAIGLWRDVYGDLLDPLARLEHDCIRVILDGVAAHDVREGFAAIRTMLADPREEELRG